MAEYRYYAADMKTRKPLHELPLYGTFMDRVMSGAGNFTGSVRLGTGVLRDDLLLGATIPGKHAIVVWRDNDVIWAGPMWSRTWNSDTGVLQVTGQTYESIFDKIAFTVDFGQQNTDEVTVLVNTIAHMQSQTAGAFNFNFTLPSVALSGNLRTVVYRALEGHLISEVFSDLASLDGALDYTINITPTDTGYLPVGMEFQVLNPAVTIDSGIYLDYPGSISKYWFSENAIRAGVSHVAKTTDSQYGDVIASTDNTDLITAGYPRWYTMQSYSNIANITALQAAANKQAEKYKMPIPTPTFELRPELRFTGWNKIGQIVKLAVQDPRFPSGQSFTKRLVGWSITPGDGEQPENLKIQLEGVDA